MNYKTILADPPWRFTNRTGKISPEHKRLGSYETMSMDEITSLPVKSIAADPSHLYLWTPNAMLPDALEVMKAWGFTYKTNLIWYKIRKDGGPDRRGVGFYFRNVTEMILFGIRGKSARTLQPARSLENIILAMKSIHSRKPEQLYNVIESCSNGPYIELFARQKRDGWISWGNQIKTPAGPDRGFKDGSVQDNIGSKKS